MESFKVLERKFKSLWPFGKKSTSQVPDAFCCLRFGEKSLSFVYLRSELGRPEIQLMEALPCDPSNPLEELKDFVEKNNLQGIDCSWMLQPDKYQLVSLEELPVKPEEFQAAVRWQVKKLLSFPTENAFIDSFPVPPPQMANPKKMITVVAAQASYIQPLALQIVNSGLNLKVIDIPEMGLRNITSLYEQDDLSTALIYLQEKSSELLITRNKTFYFSRKLEWSFEFLTRDMSSQEVINRYLDRLALEIQRSFDYFQSQWRAKPPSRVLIVSLSPEVLDIAAYLTQRLRFPVQNLDLNTVMLSKPVLTNSLECQYLPLIGGALRNEVADAAG
jgi:MSHA biogenesis protein MshI